MTKEQKARMEELSNILKYASCGTEEWKKAYDEYFELSAIEQEEYRERALPEITKYFEEHIKGKSWEEIDQDCWGWYSDWHKDVFGFRPRQTRELGARY